MTEVYEYIHAMEVHITNTIQKQLSFGDWGGNKHDRTNLMIRQSHTNNAHLLNSMEKKNIDRFPKHYTFLQIIYMFLIHSNGGIALCLKQYIHLPLGHKRLFTNKLIVYTHKININFGLLQSHKNNIFRYVFINIRQLFVNIRVESRNIF